MIRRVLKTRSVVMILMVVPALNVLAQNEPPTYVRRSVGAVVEMLDSTDDAAIRSFISTSMVEVDPDQMDKLASDLEAIRERVKGLRDDVIVEGEPDGVRIVLADGTRSEQVRVRLDETGIFEVALVEAPASAGVGHDLAAFNLTTLPQKLNELEEEGLSGVVSVRIDGKIVLEEAYGWADPGEGRHNRPDTIFGVGSRPIDFTMASIYLLEQQGRLKMDDVITEYFEDVPSDKGLITIRHLMTGASGLRDFHGDSSDWDQDLAWIDRGTAVRRILAQLLLFEPGTGEAHSHSAFGLLAAIVEMQSGQEYYDFIRESFLEPAGMTRTGEYGESRGFAVSDFAVGAGPSRVGLPNIPPNWGPTSWLVKGSGGMYSTVGDLIKFYEFIRAGGVLKPEYVNSFSGRSVNLDGSDRGFELFSSYDERGTDEAFLMVNMTSRSRVFQDLARALDRIVTAN